MAKTEVAEWVEAIWEKDEQQCYALDQSSSWFELSTCLILISNETFYFDKFIVRGPLVSLDANL